jgi:hypothetical protein
LQIKEYFLSPPVFSTGHPWHMPTPHAITLSSEISHGMLNSAASIDIPFNIAFGPQANIFAAGYSLFLSRDRSKSTTVPLKPKLPSSVAY